MVLIMKYSHHREFAYVSRLHHKLRCLKKRLNAQNHKVTTLQNQLLAQQEVNQQLNQTVEQLLGENKSLHQQIYHIQSSHHTIEKVVLESWETLESLMSTIDEGLCVLDDRGNIVYVNKPISQIFGYASVEEFVALGHGSGLLHLLQLRFRDGTPLTWEVLATRTVFDSLWVVPLIVSFCHQETQSQRWITLKSTSVIRSNQLQYIVILVQDITYYKQAEAAMEAQKNTLHVLLNALQESVILIDQEGQVLESNITGASRLNLSRSQLVGSQWAAHFDPDIAHRQQQWLAQVMASNAPLHVRDHYLNRDLHISFWPCLDSSNRVYQVVIFSHEQTNQWQLRDQLRQKEELLELIFDNIPIMLTFYNPKTGETLVNREWEATMGWTIEELKGIDQFSEFYPDPTYRQVVVDFINQENRCWRDLRTRVRNGSIVDTCWANVKLSDGCIIGIGQDVTERKRQEAILRSQIAQEQLVAKVAHSIHISLDLGEILKTAVVEVREFIQVSRVLIYMLNTDQTMGAVAESCGEGVRSIQDWSVSESWHLGLPTIGILHPGEAFQIDDIYHKNLPDSQLQLLEFFQIRAKLLLPIYVSNQMWGTLCLHQCDRPHVWQPEDIRLLNQLAIHIGIAIYQANLYQDLNNLNRQLQHQVFIDGLTGIANRRHCDHYLQQEWQRLLREQKPLSIILCDIDFFKQFNDRYGHPAGDVCLRGVAQFLARSVTRPRDLVARYGGEEFMLILPNTHGLGAQQIAQRICSGVRRERLAHKDSTVNAYITLSLGVATVIPQIHYLSDQLVEAADQALYQAKKTGRDRYCINSLD